MLGGKSEKWMDVPEYEGFYKVSNHGRVRSVTRKRNGISGCTQIHKGKLRKYSLAGCGYPSVSLSKFGKIKQFYVHRLVWISFVGPIPSGMEINHKDAVKTNNRLSNLELVTPKQNSQHAIKMGINVRCLTGSKNHTCKLTPNQVLEIRRIMKTRAMSQKKIAQRFSVSAQTITNIKQGITYSDV